MTNIADSDAFSFYETNEDLNGDTTSPESTDQFTFSESEDVDVVGGYAYYPPFSVRPVSMIYTASFGGDRGYEEPTTKINLTAGTEYPRINATLYDIDDTPLDLTTINGVTIDLIRFSIAYVDGTFASLTCTVDTTREGGVYFAWPSSTVIGVHPARFTLFDDQSTDIPLLSVPTWPLHVNIREAP